MEITNAEKYVEKFSSDFQQLLTPDNTFYLNTKGEVTNALSVNIPQWYTEIAGPSDVTVNGALDVVEWTEDNVVVTQSRFKTKAYQIVDFKEFFTNSAQRENAMIAMKAFIDTKVGNYAAYKMGVDDSDKIVMTSGTGTRHASVAGGAAAVKKITLDDMLKVKSLMGKSNLPGQWYALMSPDQIADLMALTDLTTADKLGVQSRLLSGEFADLLGIKVFQRQATLGSSVVYELSGTPGTYSKIDAYGTVGAADSVTSAAVGSVIFWNENAAYSATGLVKTYVTSGDARYQSDLLSLQYTYGIEPMRKDNVGLIALIETI